MNRSRWMAVLGVLITTQVRAALPPPPGPDQLSDWSNSFDPSAPGLLAADNLLDRPAGGRGSIVVKNGHFYSGDKRVRFWGMNFAFNANFPTHAQADALAHRLARFGINAVRLHHMDNQPFPNGIFADATLTTLSPEALDRLDYFIAQLAANGIWSDINLHVSRAYNRFKPETRDHPQPQISKLVDLFDPQLIDLQKQYAHDLLTHVNAYTHHRYADEPAVAIVEINNENSLFMWDAKEKLASLPAPYDAELRKQWNAWLLAKYHSRDGVAKAWSAGSEPLGKQMLTDPDFTTLGGASPWFAEAHDAVKLTAAREANGVLLITSHVDRTAWHAQFTHGGVAVKAGRSYTASFRARADKPVTIDVTVVQAHEPWENLGLSSSATLSTADQLFTFSFVATKDDRLGRLSFVVGGADTTIHLSQPMLAPGGVTGLADGEDPATATIAMSGTASTGTRARTADWYTFLEETEARYYAGMHDYLKNDLGVKCPITGTIAFGLLPLKAQLGMDFIDAHAYWQHPTFPHKAWSAVDWDIKNTPMVDSPDHNTLFDLAGYRVAGKPFTVTEYNEPAPGDWQAECVPMIASYAAAQDWDGVFLFAYSHSDDFNKPIAQDFFNFEGNPLKMPLVPMGARLFLGGYISPIDPSHAPIAVNPDPAAGASPFASTAASLMDRAWITYTPSKKFDVVRWLSLGNFWNANGSGTGSFTYAGQDTAVFVGFKPNQLPFDFGPPIPGNYFSNAPDCWMRIREMSSPFAAIICTPAENHPRRDTDRLLLTAVARAQNTGMQWNADRTSVGTHWGYAPEQIERVVATILLHDHYAKAYALDPTGKPFGPNLATPAGADTSIQLGTTAAQAYVIDRH